MIIYQHRIHRIDLQNNPGVLYIFGDNLDRYGMGGQAGQMRGEHNAIGVATKKRPGMNDEDFYTDDDLLVNKRMFWTDLYSHHKLRGLNPKSCSQIVVVPADGIGTGLSEMPTRCPKTFKYLCSLGLGGANVKATAL